MLPNTFPAHHPPQSSTNQQTVLTGLKLRQFPPLLLSMPRAPGSIASLSAFTTTNSTSCPRPKASSTCPAFQLLLPPTPPRPPSPAPSQQAPQHPPPQP